MPRPSLEVAEIVRVAGPSLLASGRLSSEQRQALLAIARCRTAALGGHLERCAECAWERPAYNSCRNRHCPKCQTLAQQRWLEQRRAELLPVGYFHVVFTVPSELAGVARRWPRAVYGLLLRSAGETLLGIGREERYLGAEIGVLAVLHTWTQRLGYHPHVHCVVTGGGLRGGRSWRSFGEEFLAPVRVLGALFRGKVCAGLREAVRRGALEASVPWSRLYQRPWVVYCKAPFGSPAKVLGYLSRYTHRVALSNDRLRWFDGERVCFGYRDRASGEQREETVPATEFLARFVQHVLPRGLVRTRCYGLLANRGRTRKLEIARTVLSVAERRVARSVAEILEAILGRPPGVCPRCRSATLLVVQPPLPRCRSP